MNRNEGVWVTDAEWRRHLRLAASHEQLLAACESAREFLECGAPIHPGSFVSREIKAAVTKVRAIRDAATGEEKEQ